MKVFRINLEFRVLSLTFHSHKILNSADYNSLSDIITEITLFGGCSMAKTSTELGGFMVL